MFDECQNLSMLNVVKHSLAFRGRCARYVLSECRCDAEFFSISRCSAERTNHSNLAHERYPCKFPEHRPRDGRRCLTIADFACGVLVKHRLAFRGRCATYVLSECRCDAEFFSIPRAQRKEQIIATWLTKLLLKFPEHRPRGGRRCSTIADFACGVLVKHRLAFRGRCAKYILNDKLM
jgi:hypothetical protein